MSLASLARAHRLPPKEFEKQYKDHLSGFKDWDQKNHTEEWLLFAAVEEKKLDAFLVPMESIRLRETTVLNYFVHRSTNASAESFNAKLKNFRTVVRGVTDKTFHLFRVAKLYA